MSFCAKIRSVTHKAETLKELSEAYCRVRDDSGEGMSTFRNAIVKQNGKVVGYISYNGRIWPGTTYQAGAIPLYDSW